MNWLPLALSVAMMLPPPACGAERPNIFWIIAEDMGPTALSCYGQRQVATPNLDKLAAQGVRYTRAYTTGPGLAPLFRTEELGLFGFSC